LGDEAFFTQIQPAQVGLGADHERIHDQPVDQWVAGATR